MPLTRPIPPEAMPAVEWVRANIPRPKEIPKRHLEPGYQGCGGWLYPLGWSGGDLGLFSYFRIMVGSLPRSNRKAWDALWRWWMQQRNGKAAVDAIWEPDRPWAKPCPLCGCQQKLEEAAP